MLSITITWGYKALGPIAHVGSGEPWEVGGRVTPVREPFLERGRSADIIWPGATYHRLVELACWRSQDHLPCLSGDVAPGIVLPRLACLCGEKTASHLRLGGGKRFAAASVRFFIHSQYIYIYIFIYLFMYIWYIYIYMHHVYYVQDSVTQHYMLCSAALHTLHTSQHLALFHNATSSMKKPSTGVMYPAW